MFERFSPAAMQVIVSAQEEARALGHAWLGTEHLLLGVLAQPGQPGVSTLLEVGVTFDAAKAALMRTIGTSKGLDTTDADALRSLGIDLDEVRARVEAAFGPGALDRPPRQRPRRRLSRYVSRRCNPGYETGYLPLRPRAKRALEDSARAASSLGDRHIGVQHVLLGCLDPKGNMAVDLLRHLGADPKAVRECVLAGLGKAA